MILKSILINLILVVSVYCGVVRDEQSSNNKCLLKLSNDEFEPLLILRDEKSDNHTFVTGKQIEIEMNKSVWLSCAPFKLQQFPDTQLVKATCKTEQTLEIDGIEMEFSDLKCEQVVKQYYEHPVDGCKANEEFKSVKSVQESFYDPIYNIFYVTREICYDDVKENIIFAHGKLSYKNRNLLPLNFQNGQFIVPLYKLSMYNLTKSLERNIAKLDEMEAVSYTDKNAALDLLSLLRNSSNERFIAKTIYKPEVTVDVYLGRFGEDNIISHTFNYGWGVMKTDEHAVGVVHSEKNLSLDVNKICPGGEVDIILNCKYEDMQKTVFGMPELKID